MEANKRVLIAQANLIAQDLVQQTPDGIRLTEKGMAKAGTIWELLSDEDKLLLFPFLRSQLHLMFKGG